MLQNARWKPPLIRVLSTRAPQFSFRCWTTFSGPRCLSIFTFGACSLLSACTWLKKRAFQDFSNTFHFQSLLGIAYPSIPPFDDFFFSSWVGIAKALLTFSSGGFGGIDFRAPDLRGRGCREHFGHQWRPGRPCLESCKWRKCRKCRAVLLGILPGTLVALPATTAARRSSLLPLCFQPSFFSFLHLGHGKH